MPHNEFRFEIYEDATIIVNRWRWRLVAANGRIVADSGQGYDTKWNAKRSAVRLKRARIRTVK